MVDFRIAKDNQHWFHEIARDFCLQADIWARLNLEPNHPDYKYQQALIAYAKKYREENCKCDFKEDKTT